MNTIYIGVDFHARQQTICYLTTETGELVTAALKHEPKTAVRTFYEQFSGQVIVGLEASGYSPWFEHYNKRSNVESVFHMLKSKFGQRLRSKSLTAQINEALCKVLCHNLCVVIQSVHELGIETDFTTEEAA